MHCSNCGANLEAGAAFCSHCGSALQQTPAGFAADAGMPPSGAMPPGGSTPDQPGMHPGAGMPYQPGMQQGAGMPYQPGMYPGAGMHNPGAMPVLQDPPVQKRTSGMAIAGFVLSFFCGLLGLIFSIIGYNECKNSQGAVQGQGLALAGIIISSVSMFIGFMMGMGGIY